jgi:hypothetical protein
MEGTMTDTDKRPARAAELRRAVLDRFARKLDKYLPESGDAGPWKLGEMELALLDDMNEVACGVIESRIGADPNRTVEKPKCPECGLALGGLKRDRTTHKQTLFGPIRYSRTYGTCQACGLAFSPSGEVFRLRQGLL